MAHPHDQESNVKAIVYHGPGEKQWEEVPDPQLIDDTDAIVRVDTVTICGTDLHILKGDVPAVTDGRILGHEAVGTVEEVGAGVKNVAVGDRVLVSCISACGRCDYCRQSMYGQCLGGGGWILGHLIDGTQAEKVRVPFADTSTYPVPDGVSDEALLMLADILPTGYEVGVLNGGVEPGASSRSSARGPSASPPSPARSCCPRATSSRSTSPTPGWRRPSSSVRPRPSTTPGRTRSS
jgi:alcohol dehydrogenase